MKNRKSYYSLLLALVLCLCLTACGGSGDTIDDGGEDYSGNEVNTPDSFEGMVKDSELATNYAMYWGTWVDADNNSELIVAMADSGDEVRFDLYQDGSIEASGFVQFSQEYSGDYFYNEFDGWAHHCWLADDGTLQIEGFGGFEKDTSAGDMDASDTGDADADVSALAGMVSGRRRECRKLDRARRLRHLDAVRALGRGRLERGRLRDAPRERRQPIRGGIRRV